MIFVLKILFDAMTMGHLKIGRDAFTPEESIYMNKLMMTKIGYTTCRYQEQRNEPSGLLSGVVVLLSHLKSKQQILFTLSSQIESCTKRFALVCSAAKICPERTTPWWRFPQWFRSDFTASVFLALPLQYKQRHQFAPKRQKIQKLTKSQHARLFTLALGRSIGKTIEQ